MRYRTSSWLVVVVLLMCSFARAADQAKVVLAGKAATGLVVRGDDRALGTVFCVHEAGFFATSDHVVRALGANGQLKVILQPGTDRERIVNVRVARRDTDNDLAILKCVEPEGSFDALSLGVTEGLLETTSITILGFPFGKSLVVENQDYPNVTINIARVTSLRMSDGELKYIQFDSQLSPGNSGGPILDAEGRVIGIARATVFGANINLAVPVEQLSKLVEKPELEFRPPRVNIENMHEALRFEADFHTLLGDSSPPEITLTLQPSGKAARDVSMTLKDGTYEAAVVPVPKRTDALPLKLTARFAEGQITGVVRDRNITIGDEEIPLRTIRRVDMADMHEADMEPGATLLLHSQEERKGALAGLGEVRVDLGPVAVLVDLSEAERLEIAQPKTPGTIAYSLVARRDGKELGRRKGRIVIGGGALTASISPSSTIRPPRMTKDRVEFRLPAKVARIAVGGAGRYLVMHLPKLRKIAVFDVNAAEIVHYIPAGEDVLLITAGMSKLVVALPNSRVFQRWNLATGERELAVPFPFQGVIKHISMGAGSEGPLLVNHRGGHSSSFQLLSMQDFKESKIAIAKNSRMSHSAIRIRASTNGRVWGMWRIGISPSGLASMVIRGDKAVHHYDHTSVGSILPGPDGDVLYTGRGLYTNELKPLQSSQSSNPRYVVTFPAVHGHYWFRTVASAPHPSLTNNQEKGLTVYIKGESQPLVTIPQFDVSALFQRRTNPHATSEHEPSLDERLYLLPDANLFVFLPPTNDRLVLHRFDVQEALERAGIDYLFVTSRPPFSVKKGEQLLYEIKVKSKKGGVKYKLESGPAGMRIGSDGALTWEVPHDAQDRAAIIVSVSDDSGQERFHSFTLNIVD